MVCSKYTGHFFIFPPIRAEALWCEESATQVHALEECISTGEKLLEDRCQDSSAPLFPTSPPREFLVLFLEVAMCLKNMNVQRHPVLIPLPPVQTDTKTSLHKGAASQVLSPFPGLPHAPLAREMYPKPFPPLCHTSSPNTQL